MIFGEDPTRHWVRVGGGKFVELQQKRTVWRCSVCGDRRTWQDGWESYSSPADEDVAEIPFVTCSKECRESSRGREMKHAADMLGKRRCSAAGVGPYPAKKVAAALKVLGLWE